MTAPARRTGDPEAGAVVECVRRQGAAFPPSRDDAAGPGFAEAQPRFQLSSCFTDVRDRRAGLRRSAADQTTDWRRPCYSANSAVLAITVGSRLEPQWWTAAQGSRQSRHQDNSFAAADQLRRPVNHAQLSMMHSVYEIRVTLSTKKSMRSGPDGWRRRQRYAVRPGRRAPRTDVSCHRLFITQTWRDSRN